MRLGGRQLSSAQLRFVISSQDVGSVDDKRQLVALMLPDPQRTIFQSLSFNTEPCYNQGEKEGVEGVGDSSFTTTCGGAGHRTHPFPLHPFYFHKLR